MRVLFVGAHPDDIEIGAAGLVQRLVEHGTEVWLLVLSDDEEGRTRRAEARRSASILGVAGDRVLFAGFEDGRLAPRPGSVQHLRDLTSTRGCHPAVVVTHSAHDSHNDHRCANELSRAAFPGRIFLCYSIHISAELSYFAPRFFIQIDERTAAIKDAALREHRSQQARISKASLCAHEEALAHPAGLIRAEAFEVLEPVDPQDDTAARLMAHNDSAFHRFWYPLIKGDEVYLLYQEFRDQPRSIHGHTTYHESSGRDVLRDAFVGAWHPRTPLRERFSNSPDAEAILREHHVVLVGGAVSNPITREYFNRFSSSDWVVEYDMPNREPVYLLRRSTGHRIRPTLSPDGGLIADVGVASVVKNPMNEGRSVVAAAGVHGLGTQGILAFLADPRRHPDVLDKLVSRSPMQVPVRVAVADLALSLLPGT